MMCKGVWHTDTFDTAMVSPSAPGDSPLKLEAIPAVFQQYRDDYSVLGWLLLDGYWFCYQIPELFLL